MIALILIILALTPGDRAHIESKRGRIPEDPRPAIVAPHRAFLAKLRACEVRGQRHPYRTNTGNGFSGAYQFTLSSWQAVGGKGLPYLNSKLEQDYRAVLLLRAQGPGAWPVCSR